MSPGLRTRLVPASRCLFLKHTTNVDTIDYHARPAFRSERRAERPATRSVGSWGSPSRSTRASTSAPAEVALANPLGQLLPAKRRRDRRNRPGRAEKTDAIVLPRAW